MCRWEVPVGKSTRFISLPNTTPAFKSGIHAQTLGDFFVEYMGVVDCDVEDIIYELDGQRNQVVVDLELVDNCYRYLDETRKTESGSVIEEIR